MRACWFSMSARAVTAEAPRMVPRMVCGRRNFQNASRKAPAFSAADRAPESPCRTLPDASQVMGRQVYGSTSTSQFLAFNQAKVPRQGNQSISRLHPRSMAIVVSPCGDSDHANASQMMY